MNYESKANKFGQKYGVKLEVLESDWRKYFDGDKQARAVFKMRISRNRKRYTFTFGQSIAKDGEAPTLYDVLTCFQKYDPGTFENFCGDFGYDTDSRRAYQTYKAVLKEYEAVERLFGDVMEELMEIE